MKKFFSLIMVVAAFAFAACEEPVVEGGKLDTPVVEVAEVADYGFTVTWGAIEGADSYTVNMKGKNYTTVETTYTFENLNAGEYVVRVMATGEGYDNSEFGSVTVNLTGATSVDWFTQTVALSEVNEAEGIYPYNSIDFIWKGTGVTEIRYNLYEATQIQGVDEQDIKNYLQDVSDPTVLDEVNGDGFFGQFKAVLNAGTEYALCVEAVNGDGLKFFTINKITTETFDVPAETQAWIGTWNATTSKVITIGQDGKGTLSNKTEEFAITIAASSIAPDMVVIDGLSVLGDGNPTYGYVDGNTLTITTNINIGQNAEQAIYYYWLPYIAIDGELMGLNMFESEVPSHVLTMAEDGTVTGETGKFLANLEDGTEVTIEVVCSEVYGVSAEGKLYFFIEAFPAVYRAGDMQVTKAAAPTAKRLNKVAKNYPMSLSSVVF